MSIGLRSRPARQTIRGIADGIGVVSLAVQAKTGAVVAGRSEVRP